MNTHAITLYGIPNCDTVKKARAWLLAQGQEATFVDFKKLGVPPAALNAWIQALGWQVVLNTRGTTWRKLDETTRAGITDATSAHALMLAHTSVIKRPVVTWADGSVSVGFDEADWRGRIA